MIDGIGDFLWWGGAGSCVVFVWKRVRVGEFLVLFECVSGDFRSWCRFVCRFVWYGL